MTEKEIRKVSSEMEVRSLGEGEPNAIVGYALKFNRWSDTLGGWFREILEPESLRDADMTSVVALFNHDDSKILGRVGKNLELTVDEIGLRFEVTPTNTTYAKDLMENIRSGIVSQCSFAFSIPDEKGAEEWRKADDGIMERRIKRINRIYDVSPVTTPAYPDTDVIVSPRSKELAKEVRNTEPIVDAYELEVMKMEAELM